MTDMDFPGIEYFTSNPKGHLLERHVKNNFPNFYAKLMEYPGELKFSERIYWYFNKLTEKPKCPICGGSPKFISFNEGYLQFCSYKCSMHSTERILKIKNTMLEKYGVENASQSQEVKDKKKKTSMIHYGVEHPLQSDDIKTKQKRTMLEKYGVENASQSQEVKDKKKRTSMIHYGVEYPLQSDQIKENVKATCMTKYGVENASQSQEVKDKKKRTVLEKYGVENVFQSKDVKLKIRKKLIKKYGVEHPSQSDQIREKVKATCMTKYGVSNTFQLPDVKERAIQTIFKKAMKNHEDIISINMLDGTVMYSCRCPHETCNKCENHMYNIPGVLYNNRKNKNIELCTNLLPIDNHHNSGGTLEIFIRQLLDEYHIKYETNNRTILSGKELDVYIPDYKLAIECNGIYWHSLKEPIYHHQKWLECKNQGVQLLTIWEDQIINQPDIVANIILSRLSIYEHNVGANKCRIKTVSSKESINFLRTNHLQGSVNGSIRLGLYHKDELISLMVFGRKRTALDNKSHDQWELYRYCCKKGWSIVGGAKRLFTHFIKEYPDVEIETFSSNDISGGGLYDRLDFKQVHIQPYSYWYIDKNMNRYHRYSYRKDVLVKNGADPSLTEFQITDQMGLFRIYDTGQIKWIYNSKKETDEEE